MNVLAPTTLLSLASTILLHPGEEHETTAAATGGVGVPEIAVGVFAVAGLAVGLYLLVGAVDVRAEGEAAAEADEDPAEDPV